jgi:hypothetical protein
MSESSKSNRKIVNIANHSSLLAHLHLLPQLLLASTLVVVEEELADQGQPVEGVDGHTIGICAVTVSPLVVTCGAAAVSM